MREGEANFTEIYAEAEPHMTWIYAISASPGRKEETIQQILVFPVSVAPG